MTKYLAPSKTTSPCGAPFDTLPLDLTVLRIVELIRPLSPERANELDQLLGRLHRLYHQLDRCVTCGQSLQGRESNP